MKVIIATSLFILLGFSSVNTVLGQQIGHLSITDVHVQNIGDSIELSFYCTPYLSLRKERIIVTPILADSIHQLRLPSFVIIGKRGKKTFIRSSDYLRNMKLTNSDQAFLYNSIVKYEEWMNGSTLSFNSLTKCCLKESVPTVVEVKEKIFEDKTGEEVKSTKEAKAVASTADKLSDRYSFLSAFTSNRYEIGPILFRVVSSSLSIEYQDNERYLDLIVDVINKINNSNDSRIIGISIIGHSSPEGNYHFNMELAEKRAKALRNYLAQNTDIDISLFEIINGGIDWPKLHNLVSESDMVDKESVLKIIESSVVQEKQFNSSLFMDLENEISYRYMQKNLFPQLRSSSCIKILYKNIE